MDALYFGARPTHDFIRMMDNAGYGIIHARYEKGILASVPNCGAIVLHWNFKKDQQVIKEAKAAGLPAMVITSKLALAYDAGDTLADLYLEKPARDEDVAALLIDLMSAAQPDASVTSNRRMKSAA